MTKTRRPLSRDCALNLQFALAEVMELSGAMAYGNTRGQAIARAEALALRIIADRLEQDETLPALDSIFAVVA